METIRENKPFFIFESILFIIMGIIAIAIPQIFTVGLTLLVGFLFIIGAVIQAARCFQISGAADIGSSAVSAVIYAVIGILILLHPTVGILSLTMLLAIIFFAQGLIQLYWGFTSQRLRRWGWWIFSGLISIALALIIWCEWPYSAAWFIGLLVGVNLIFYGFSLLFITLEAE
ncbi:MAG: hypothetical protein K940chlam3_00314 [Chlamydiae bacterium]|nr:hypothetical protein [Chlamydiota bacterium]